VTAAPPAPKKHAVEAAEEFSEEEAVECVTDILLKHRVPGFISERIVTAAIMHASRDPRQILAIALQKTFAFAPQTVKAPKPILLVGPPGAGKTLMAAKLAAKAVLEGKRPAVITTDIARAGGVEQLSAFLDILKLPLHQAEDAKTLKTALLKVKTSAPVIIDTGGLNPFDPQEMKLLAKLMAVEELDAMLVLPAGIDAEESAEMAMTFEVLGVRKIIPTRLDFARRIGGILSAADKGKLAFGLASHTPAVAEGTVLLTPLKLSEFLMPYLPSPAAVKKGRHA
jgi:flagellar biosynthesis protein FlhF